MSEKKVKKPKKAKGMVSERTLEEAEIPENLDPLQTYIAEQLYEVNCRLQRLIEILSGAEIKDVDVPIAEVPTDVPVEASVEVSPPAQPTRIDEIKSAFEVFGDLVTIDTESSAQFVLVRPKGYLKDDWSPINTVAMELAGSNCWVSQGKQSHWKIPKINGKKQTSAPEIPQSVNKTSLSPEDTIMSAFTIELQNLLKFEKLGDKLKISPKSFLGSDNFAKIAAVVRELNGEYVSAGKESHFIVPFPKTA